MAKKQTQEKRNQGGPQSAAGDSLEDLAKKNIRWSRVIYNQNKKIKSRLTWMAVGNYLRLLILIIPIILGIIYLPSILEEFWQVYADILGGVSEHGSFSKILNQMAN